MISDVPIKANYMRTVNSLNKTQCELIRDFPISKEVELIRKHKLQELDQYGDQVYTWLYRNQSLSLYKLATRWSLKEHSLSALPCRNPVRSIICIKKFKLQLDIIHVEWGYLTVNSCNPEAQCNANDKIHHCETNPKYRVVGLIRVKLGDCGQNIRMTSRTSRKQEERINLVTTTIIMRKSQYVNKIWHLLMKSMEKTAII